MACVARTWQANSGIRVVLQQLSVGAGLNRLRQAAHNAGDRLLGLAGLFFCAPRTLLCKS